MKPKIHDPFIFMKVGNHAGETFETILKRKKREYERTGKIFWGYGGAACHPVNQVRPFALQQAKKKDNIYLLMSFVTSNADQDTLRAREFSIDGIEWQEIPKDIVVTGSKYALVLDEITETDLEIDMNQFLVGYGPSRDKKAIDYLKGRTDKACLIPDLAYKARENPVIKKIEYQAKLQDPYAVLLRY
jgi:hypothetical protein